MNQTTENPVHVIGGGLAGSEAAWQLARAGVPFERVVGWSEGQRKSALQRILDEPELSRDVYEIAAKALA